MILKLQYKEKIVYLYHMIVVTEYENDENINLSSKKNSFKHRKNEVVSFLLGQFCPVSVN